MAAAGEAARVIGVAGVIGPVPFSVHAGIPDLARVRCQLLQPRLGVELHYHLRRERPVLIDMFDGGQAHLTLVVVGCPLPVSPRLTVQRETQKCRSPSGSG